MQVYSDLWILTARPSLLNMAINPMLHGVIDGGIRCNVSLWLKYAKKEVEKARWKEAFQF